MQVNVLKVSVIIPTYNRGRYLIQTLEQLFTQSRPADEILVIDQTPRYKPEIKELLGRFVKEEKIKLFHQDIPNLPMARNRGIKEAKTDVLIFIDDDVLINRDFINNHIINYADDEIVGVTGQMLTKERPLCVDKFLSKRSSHFLDWLDFPLNFAFRATTILMVGSNFSVRRSVAIKVKGFDTNFINPSRAEDNDFSWRVNLSGGKVVYEPSAKVFNLTPHYGGCYVVRDRIPMSVVVELQNKFYFYLKDLIREYPFRTTKLILGCLRGWLLIKNNIFNPYFIILIFSRFFCALYRAIFLLIKGQRLLDT